MLWRASLRHLTRHPWQIGLSVLGVALGVAVVMSIDLANESARRSFALFTETVAGHATHEVVGGPAGLPDAVYRRVRIDARMRASAPVVERDVAAADVRGLTFHLLGVDPFAETPFRSLVSGESAGVPALLTRPGTVLIARDMARRLGLGPGATLVVRVGTARRRLTVAGVLVPRDELSARMTETLLVADISTAQEVLGMPGRLTRIDLIVENDARRDAILDRVRAALPPGASLVRAGARVEAVDQMTRAFRLNLTALSLLALVVGTFLIYNTMTFSVVQRRELFGALRALGVTRAELCLLVLGEALAVGLLATALGLPLGVALGHGLTRLVTRTVNDLYVTLTVNALAVPAAAVVKAAALGVGATLLAALAPALEAARTRPRAVLMRSTLETRWRHAAPRLALAGVGSALGGFTLLAAGDRSLGLAFAGLFAILIGSAMLTPAATVVIMQALRPLMGRLLGQVGRMATGSVVQALSRTSVALAALMIAVSATVGVGVMVRSFRETVVRWLGTSLQADVYVSAPSLVSNRPDSTLDPALIARIRAAPDVARVTALRVARVQSPTGPVRLLALDADARGFRSFTLKEGEADTVPDALLDGGAVIVSEPFAWRRGLRVGSWVPLVTDRGQRSFRVAGVYRDYGSSEGVVLMSRRTYDGCWSDPAVSSLGVYARPGISADALVESLRRLAGPADDVLVRSNRALREASLTVFDRTFAVTVVLRYLAMAVAFVGVLAALTALALERSRELGVLRAHGLTPGEVWKLVTVQTGLMGLVAGVLAVPVGIVQALVLIFVVNQRSFGWTLELELAPGLLAQALLLAVAAGVLAGLYPAHRIARLSLPAALRGE
jgi:putative ABC transport system permease protein